jgi:hypothetical protein
VIFNKLVKTKNGWKFRLRIGNHYNLMTFSKREMEVHKLNDMQVYFFCEKLIATAYGMDLQMEKK